MHALCNESKNLCYFFLMRINVFLNNSVERVDEKLVSSNDSTEKLHDTQFDFKPFIAGFKSSHESISKVLRVSDLVNGKEVSTVSNL